MNGLGIEVLGFGRRTSGLPVCASEFSVGFRL